MNGFIVVALLASALTDKLDALAASKGQEPEPQRLRQLFEVTWKAGLDRHPEFATFVGAPGHGGRWTDLSPAAFAEIRQEHKATLAAARTIDAGALETGDQLNLDLFTRQAEIELEGDRFPHELLLLSQMEGPQERIIATLSSMPAATVADYEDILSRLNGVEVFVDQTIALLQRGVETGIVRPKVILRGVPGQIRGLLNDDPARHPALRAFSSIPPSIPVAEQKRLQGAAAVALRGKFIPAFNRLLEFTEKTYLPACRDSIALAALPDGAAWYAYQAARMTTTLRSPEEIHQLGLREVARIKAEMQKLVTEAKFDGTLAAFQQFLRKDPRFFFTNEADLVRAYRDLAKRADPQLVKLFGKLPRLPYGVEEIPKHTAPQQTTAYYRPGSPEGHRAGTYFVNTYDLGSRPKWEMEALTLHESVPGHHLQISLAYEQGDLPMFRRFGRFTAYTEGWGLYAESLGYEMGFYTDPYSHFGALSYEMWRAIRLVVDTGMHAFGWSRQKAIDYFLENSPKPQHDVEVEIDRYIGWPGQALAYKIGQLEIKQLREDSTRALGASFDLRAFHDALLGAGALPLDLLQKRMRAWTDAQKAAAK